MLACPTCAGCWRLLVRTERWEMASRDVQGAALVVEVEEEGSGQRCGVRVT